MSNITTERLTTDSYNNFTTVNENFEHSSLFHFLFLAIPCFLLVLIIISFIVLTVIKKCSDICGCITRLDLETRDIFMLCQFNVVSFLAHGFQLSQLRPLYYTASTISTAPPILLYKTAYAERFCHTRVENLNLQVKQLDN